MNIENRQPLIIEPVSLEELIPYANNARTHSDAQVAQIAASIKEFGFNNPVLIDGENGIIAGHGRLMAARKIGLATVPCIRLAHLTDAQRRAFILADNKLALNAGWDEELLRLELGRLKEDGLDVELIGFSNDEVDNLFLGGEYEGQTDPDEVPEPPVEPVSRHGMVWELGPHRLACGDSTSQEDMDRLMSGDMAALMFTDPPYNVAYEGSAGKIKNDDMGDEQFLKFLTSAMSVAASKLVNGGVFYICHADSEGYNFRASVRAAGLDLKQCLIWVKHSLVLGRQDFQWRHEPILYGWKPGARHYWNGGRKQDTVLEDSDVVIDEREDHVIITIQGDDAPGGLLQIKVPSYEIIKSGDHGTSIWRVAKPSRSDEHPTMKPVALVERALMNSSHRSDIVLEPFSGSGSTLMACERTGRIARAMELDPKFVDVGVRRWQEHTGKKATLVGDGRAFDEMASLMQRASSV